MCKVSLQSIKIFICMALAALCLVTALVLALTSWSGRSNQKGSGDINQDGYTTQADLDLAVEFVLRAKSPTIKQLQAADVNGDGKLTSTDLTIICRMLPAAKQGEEKPMPTSQLRGHRIEHDGDKWVYSDNKKPIDSETRACKRCGRMPTPEGYDACLGFIPGVSSACCGHGVEEPYCVKAQTATKR